MGEVGRQSMSEILEKADFFFFFWYLFHVVCEWVCKEIEIILLLKIKPITLFSFITKEFRPQDFQA